MQSSALWRVVFRIISHYMGLTKIYESNELLYKQSLQDDRVYQWLVLDPRQDKLFSQIKEKINGRKVLGIKIHSVMHEYDINEYGDKIFSFANEFKCFVLMHNDKIPDMVNFADKPQRQESKCWMQKWMQMTGAVRLWSISVLDILIIRSRILQGVSFIWNLQ